MPASSPCAPTSAQIDHFIAHGWLRIDGAFSPETARAARAILWRQTGLSPDDPAGWRHPVIRLGHLSEPPFVAAANSPRLHAAYDALAGRGRWLRPTGLGTFPIRFPGGADPGDTGWHIDASFGTDHPDFMQWRANILSRGRALLMLFLFSDVAEDDAPTRLREGSHLHIARRLLPHGEEGLTLAELAAHGFADTGTCPEQVATGPAGTVYVCHPFLVHAAQPHVGRTPRFMAQPPLLPAHGFDPKLPPSAVQIAIRRACGLPES